MIMRNIETKLMSRNVIAQCNIGEVGFCPQLHEFAPTLLAASRKLSSEFGKKQGGHTAIDKNTMEIIEQRQGLTWMCH